MMSLKQLAVQSARYHSRMAVRAVTIFRCKRQAVESRERRDWWMAQARDA
jgi:hypothetical protein